MESNKRDVELESDVELSEEIIEEFAKSATCPSFNCQRQYVVIGLFESYRDYAQNSENHEKCTYFYLPEWRYICEVYGYDTAWKINKKFLQMQVDQGKEFISTCNPSKYPERTFGKEIEFLKSKGYIFRQKDEVWIGKKEI